jgi:hypothetical protein
MAVGGALMHPGERAVRIADAPPFVVLGHHLHRQAAHVIDPQQPMVVAGPGAGVHHVELQ